MSTKKQESTGSPAGRKPIISVDMVTKLEDALLNGMSQRGACDLVGINTDTFHTWIRISEGLNADGTHPDMPKPPRRRKGESDNLFTVRQQEYAVQVALLTEFSARMKKARASVELTMTSAIMDAVQPKEDKDGNIKPIDWRAALAYLERMFWQDFGKRTLGNDPSGDININIRIKNNEDADGA